MQAKDKAFHANGKMTAAEFKRRFLNKKAVQRATSAVDVRTTVGQLKGALKATAKDKARLRNVNVGPEAMPGDYWKKQNEHCTTKLQAGRNVSHVRVSL